MSSGPTHISESLTASLKDKISLAALITDYAAEAFFVLDPKGRIIYMNRCAERMFDFRSEELTGQIYLAKCSSAKM